MQRQQVGKRGRLASAYLPAVLLLLPFAAGCAAKGQKLYWMLEGAQWTSGLDGDVSAHGDKSDLDSDLDLDRTKSLWMFEAAVLTRGMANEMIRWNLGWWQTVTDGSLSLGTSDLYFAGRTFDSADGKVETRATLTGGKITYELNDYKAPQLTGGSLGVHMIDMRVSCKQPGAGKSASIARAGSVFTIGARWEVTDQQSGLTYFAVVEWMDTNIISITDAHGQLTDLYTGIRWALGTGKIFLTVGYRNYDANLEMGGNDASFKIEGPTAGLYARF